MAQASEHANTVTSDVFEDVTATQDSAQVIASTVDKLISIKCIQAGIRATQLLGQMSDATLRRQKLGFAANPEACFSPYCVTPSYHFQDNSTHCHECERTGAVYRLTYCRWF